jgi:hypothetical protein
VQPLPNQNKRLFLLEQVGQDAMGLFWDAYDSAGQHIVRVHELQGVYVQEPPPVPAGYELVAEAGRLFVIFPYVAPPTPRRQGWLIGGLVTGTVVLVAGAVVAAVIAFAPDPSVNIALKGVRQGECVQSDVVSSDPSDDFQASIVPCNTYRFEPGHNHEVTSVHPGIGRDEVRDIWRSGFLFCHSGNSDYLTLIWVSEDGETGTMVCMT